MPSDMETIVQMTCSALNVTTTAPTVIVIDAINQVDLFTSLILNSICFIILVVCIFYILSFETHISTGMPFKKGSSLHQLISNNFAFCTPQFDKENHAEQMTWVPRKLGPNIRCIFSMIDDTPPHKALMARESKPSIIKAKPLSIMIRKVGFYLQ